MIGVRRFSATPSQLAHCRGSSRSGMLSSVTPCGGFSHRFVVELDSGEFGVE
jgi:hypothetical protein